MLRPPTPTPSPSIVASYKRAARTGSPTYCKNNPLTTYHIEWSERCCSPWTHAGGCSWIRGVMLRPVKLAVPYAVA